jgi:hypothetical protein
VREVRASPETATRGPGVWCGRVETEQTICFASVYIENEQVLTMLFTIFRMVVGGFACEPK